MIKIDCLTIQRTKLSTNLLFSLVGKNLCHIEILNSEWDDIIRWIRDEGEGNYSISLTPLHRCDNCECVMYMTTEIVNEIREGDPNWGHASERVLKKQEFIIKNLSVCLLDDSLYLNLESVDNVELLSIQVFIDEFSNIERGFMDQPEDIHYRVWLKDEKCSCGEDGCDGRFYRIVNKEGVIN